MAKIRITNTTMFKSPPGFGLDYQDHYIPPNPARQLIVEVPVIDSVLEGWAAKGWVKIQDAEDKSPVTQEAGDISPPAVSEAKSNDALAEEEDFDLSAAKEAQLPNTSSEMDSGPVPMQPIDQSPRAKVSLGTDTSMSVADSLSPIPGDKPVSVDDSEAFTVRAPRASGPGSVVRSS